MNVDPEPPVDRWRAERYAGLVTASYALSVTVGLIALSHSGDTRRWEVPVELVWLLAQLPVIAVFPCSFVVATALFAALPPECGRSRPWRAWLAGLITAVLIFSPAGEKVAAILETWRGRWSPDETVLPQFLVPLTMIQGMVVLALAVSWSLPPWRRSRLPKGGVADGILPRGLRH